MPDAEEDEMSLTWRLVLIVLGVAWGYVVVPLVFGDAPAGSPFVLAYSLLGLAVGAPAFVFAFGAFRRRQLVRGTPTSTVRSLAVGTAEVKGEAEPRGDPLTAPLSRTEACAYELELQQRWTDDEGVHWTTEIVLAEAAPFHLDDGTGHVLVDPEPADLAFEVNERERVGPDEELPAHLQAWFEDRDVEALEADRGRRERFVDRAYDVVIEGIIDTDQADLAGTSGETRRYEERVLAPGETAYVFGAARQRNGAAEARNEANLVLEEDPSTGLFLVSDKPEATLADDTLVRTVGLAGLALVGIPWGILGVLRFTGHV